jgi:hypothetical protein
MKKGAKLGLIFGIGALAALASWYFLIYLPKHPKQAKDSKTDDQALADWLAGGAQGAPTVPTSTSTKPAPVTPPAPTVIGKKMYAIATLSVRKVNDGSLVKTQQPNTFVGIVDGETTVGGYKFYTYANKYYRVPASGVRLVA